MADTSSPTQESLASNDNHEYCESPLEAPSDPSPTLAQSVDPVDATENDYAGELQWDPQQATFNDSAELHVDDSQTGTVALAASDDDNSAQMKVPAGDTNCVTAIGQERIPEVGWTPVLNGSECDFIISLRISNGTNWVE